MHDSVVFDDGKSGCPSDITVIGPADPTDSVSVAAHAMGMHCSFILTPAQAVRLGELLVEAGQDNQDIMTSASRPIGHSWSCRCATCVAVKVQP